MTAKYASGFMTISISKSAPGCGPLKGKVWRVGLMGHGARTENVEILAKALKQLI